MKQAFTLDEEGVKSNEWYELSWTELRKLFDKEFAEKKAKEIFRANQKSGETGITYFYRMIKLHQQSKLDLDEEQLATLIIQHMNDTFRYKFDFKNYKSLNKLRNDLRSFDEKRSAELVAKNKDRKRPATLALLEAESDKFEKKKSKYSMDNRGVDRKADLDDLCSRISTLQKQLSNSTFRGNSDQRREFVRRDTGRGQGRPPGHRSNGGDRRTGYQPRKHILCYNCNRFGHHVARDCTGTPPERRGWQNRGNREFERKDRPAIEGPGKKPSAGNSSRQEC